MRQGKPIAILLLRGLLAAFTAPLSAQAGSCRLEGQVVDALWSPVIGASLVAECHGETVARTQSDAEGHYVFGRLPQDTVIVRACTETPDVGAGWIDLLGLSRGFLRLQTGPARAVTGVVQDDDGRAIAGAWVVTGPEDAGDLSFSSCCTTSDTEGHYRLTHVPFGRNVLRAWAPGHDAFEGTVDGVADVHCVCRVERDAGQERSFALVGTSPEARQTARLEVRVQHNGCPLPLPPALRHPALLDDGRWCLRGWPYADAMQARLLGDEMAVEPREHSVPADVPARHRDFVRLEGNLGLLRGQLVGDGPRGGVLLVAQPIDDLDPEHTRRTLARTHEDGSFVMLCPVAEREDFALRVADATAVASSRKGAPRSWFVATHDPEAEHHVAVLPAHTIRARVLTAAGLRAAGALGSVYGARLPQVQQARRSPQEDSETLLLATGNSDVDGLLEITGLDLQADETLSCFLTSPDGCLHQEFTASAAQVTDLGTLRLAPAASLRLLVTDAERQACPGRRIEVLEYANGVRTIRHVTADRAGALLVRGLDESMVWLRALDRREFELNLQLTADAITTAELRLSGR